MEQSVVIVPRVRKSLEVESEINSTKACVGSCDEVYLVYHQQVNLFSGFAAAVAQ